LQVEAWRGFPPAGTKAHEPALPGTLQALHPSLQDELQQTPSTQNPEAQSAGAMQEAPGGRWTGGAIGATGASSPPPSPAAGLATPLVTSLTRQPSAPTSSTATSWAVAGDSRR
jgi:hypothetical protein